jgi:hypothetical protein
MRNVEFGLRIFLVRILDFHSAFRTPNLEAKHDQSKNCYH